MLALSWSRAIGTSEAGAWPVQNAAETRRCTTIHCPFWPYRMGTNPHNPRRGVNPFSNVIPFPAKPNSEATHCRIAQ
jgi:hypothetical protein